MTYVERVETSEPSFDFFGLIERMRPDWMDRGACRAYPQDWWFPRESPDPITLDICEKCPVRVQCLEYALDNNEEHGVWGGASERRRRRIRKARRVNRNRTESRPAS